MAGSTNGIIHRVRHLLRQVDTKPDAELLSRFVGDRDAEAFALLVRRHGPMVHGVCRRVLRNAADADDAFQATFLVLARRAGAVRPQGLLGNWLYGVAYRTALEAKRAAAVRRARERRAAEMKSRVPAPEFPPDLREALDRELAALPDAYRAAIVLCDLEGLSRKDAALRLGWAEGTLSGRLFRARSMLAARLSRHGLAIPAAGIGVVAGSASAGVPAALAESTARIGVLVAAGELAAVAAAPVAALTEGVMKAMLLTKLKGLATAVVVGCAVLVTAAAGWQANAVGASAGADGQAQGQPPRKAAPRDPDKDRIAELERERQKLLQVIRDLEDRLEKLEANANLGEKLKRREVEEERALIEDAQRRRKVEDERARLTADDLAKLERLGVDRARLEIERAKLEAERACAAPPKTAENRTPAQELNRFRELERELPKDPKARERVKDAANDLAEKLKALELDAAKAAKLKALQDLEWSTKLKGPAGDRVAELEERMKAMERNIDRLLSEIERQRKK